MTLFPGVQDGGHLTIHVLSHDSWSKMAFNNVNNPRQMFPTQHQGKEHQTL